MKRYLKVLRLFWGTSLAAEAEYRANFILAFLSSLLSLGGSLFALFLFYRTGYQMGGWSWEQAMVVLGMYTLLDGFSGTFLMPNLNRIVPQVQEGTLDFVLLKPIDTQFWLSLRQVSLWGLPNVAFGVTMLFYAGHRLGLGPAAFWRGLIYLLPGLLLLYSIWFLLGTLTVWFVKIYNVTSVLRSVLEAGRYPLTAYPSRFQFFFTFLVPVAFLTTVPARAVIGVWDWPGLLAASVVAIGLFIASRFFWRFAMRYYTSASS